jgi:hypothetical protein
VGPGRSWRGFVHRLARLSLVPLLRAAVCLSLAVSVVAPRAFAADEECALGLAPEARAVFVEEAPTIDGVLDDPVWERAEVISELTEVEPTFCVPGRFRTEVRILTDGETLFFSFRNYDPEPDKIVANRMARNEVFFYDDGVNILLDTFLDRQNGYFFQVNPNGGRRDGTFARDSYEENWDGIWYADARIDSEGWTAEVALPFKTLGFRPGADVWGLNLSRRIRRFNEENRWADPSRQRFGINMSRAGTLHGMSVAKQGVGLDVVPTFSVGAVHDEEGDDSVAGMRDLDDHNELRAEPSFDAFYRVLPSLTASVTANTDFGQTEIDDARVNLSRFSLFFPEKREFFLRDSGIFTFADLQGENGIPFFSRRIGLFTQRSDNQRGAGVASGVRLLGGGRVTGRVGRYNIGFMDIQQDRNNGREGENLAVARVSANVLEESSVGFLLTHGNPNSDRENLLAGGDFNFRSSQLIPNRFVTGSLWIQQNFEGGNYGDRSTAWGGTISYPNDIINWKIRFKEIQEGFDPALGFVNRSDIRRYDFDYRYRFRMQGTKIRTVDVALDSSVTTDRTNHLESAAIFFSPVRITTQVDDSFELQALFLYEDTVSEFFYLAEHIGIQPGEYQQASVVVYLRTSQHRPVRFEYTTGFGQFFDGYGLRMAPLIEWRPNKYLLFSLQYDERFFFGIDSCFGRQGDNGPTVSCPGDSTANVSNRRFNIRLARVRAQIAFTPNVFWSTLVQYDNLSDRIEFQSRFQWIIEPGREFFIVVGQDFEAQPGDFRTRRTQPSAKLRWTFRF